MFEFIIFYLIGVVAAISLVIISNINTNPKDWKYNVILKTMIYCLSSWILVYICAVKSITD